MEHTIKIQNLKCGGCAKHHQNQNLKISRALKQLSLTMKLMRLVFQYSKDDNIALVKQTLSKLGYPADDESNSMSKKSKVLCELCRWPSE